MGFNDFYIDDNNFERCKVCDDFTNIGIKTDDGYIICKECISSMYHTLF